MSTLAEVYRVADAVCGEFRSAMLLDSEWERKAIATQGVLRDVPLLLQQLNDISKSGASGGNEASRALETALKKYESAAKVSVALFRDLSKGLAERTALGGFAGRAAMGRIRMGEARIASAVLSAWQAMAKAEGYLGQAS